MTRSMDKLNEKQFLDDITNTNIWTGKTILVVDDIYMNFLLLEAIMKKTNVRLIWAKNGLEAVKICHDHESIDLVLMDIEMPEMNGIEATREIKKIRKDIPIIVQTAYEDYYGEDEIMQAGCSQIITKPLLSEYILTTVAKYL
jgi:two-component system cell cycle response regulator DivK